MSAKIDFLYLSEPDMIKAGVKDMGKCVEVMEDMMVTLKKGDYVMGGENHNSHGCMVTFPDNPEFEGMPKNGEDRRFMAMPAYLGGNFKMAGMKWYGSNTENKQKGLPRSILMMMLNDKDTGAPLALMSANLLSAYRTGAIPGVGARYLALKNSKVCGICGPGVMGKTSLEAIINECPDIEKVKVKGRGRASLDKFVAFAKEKYPDIEVEAVDTVEELVRDSDVLSFANSGNTDPSTYPYVKGEWLKPGALILGLSCFEMDAEFMAEKCKLVVDNTRLYEAWAEEFPYPSFGANNIIGSKFTDMIHDGIIEKSQMYDLGDIISGKRTGRESDDQIIIFSVGGMPVEDVAWGKKCYENAVSLGLGTKLTLWEKPELA